MSDPTNNVNLTQQPITLHRTAPSQTIALCNSADLANGSAAVPFDVVYAGQTCRAFVIRFEDRVYAYLNRCTHVAMEMD